MKVHLEQFCPFKTLRGLAKRTAANYFPDYVTFLVKRILVYVRQLHSDQIWAL